MKINILSDLHLDINKEIPFSLANRDIFTIVCGDISANTAQTVKWMNENVQHGVFVEGNHVGYASKHSIQYLENFLSKYYPLEAPVSYLLNNYKIVNDVVFVGGILWTDFKLFGEGNQVFSMNSAQIGINDFNYNYVNIDNLPEEKERNFRKLQGLNIVRKLHPNDCVSMFDATLCAIKSACEQFPDKKIVVVTHHAPSEQSVAPMYKTDKSSPAFASNLERFILEHPNIVLWCHGHIHSRSDYFIDKCRVICNLRGYEKYENTDFESSFIIDI